MRLASAGLPRLFERTCFGDGTTLVLPSQLLADVASQQFSLSRLDENIESWQRPPIYNISAWLTARWQDARYAASGIPLLLSRSQTLALWNEVIKRESPDLFDLNATTELARSAAQTIAEWHIPVESQLWRDHDDARTFLCWLKRFRARCADEGWITHSDLWALLPKWIRSGYCAQGNISFLNFETLSPALAQLTRTLGECAAVESGSPRSPALANVTACTDFNEEIELAAKWARASFEERPSESIGIFVSSLASNRALVERAFERIFYSSEFLRFAPRMGNTTRFDNRESSVFHIHAGESLDKQPLVASALLILELARPRIATADASAILHCPFIKGSAAERSPRSFADLSLRRNRDLDVSLRDIEYASRACPVLQSIWRAVRVVLRKNAGEHEFAVWTNFIGDLVQATGWPGEAELGLHEQEAVEKWKDALSELATLGLVLGPACFDTALSHLRRLLKARSLARGDGFSPIQILDLDSAPGLLFSRAFVAGLSDESWPPPVRLSPLIPFQLQCAHGVPGSSPRSVHNLQERATRALFEVAPIIQASYSKRLSLTAARFLSEHPVAVERWTGKVPLECYTPATLDRLEDTNAPKYQANGQLRGGTYVIKAQSLCPFRAFAEIRLNAETPEDACFGLDSRDRGGFLHKALQYVWCELKTQTRLLSLGENEIAAIARKAVNDAVKTADASEFHAQNAEVERERLAQLIIEWLNFEKQRPKPFSVETLEQDQCYELAGLPLQLRIDRIDRFENGKLILIDYKSGEQEFRKLTGERPAEPQLLVYAASLDIEVDGMFLAQLKPRDLKVVGFAHEQYFAEANVEQDWNSFIEQSRAKMWRIAQGFAEGVAAVDPLKGACDYCSIRPFCRIAERAAEDEDEDED